METKLLKTTVVGSYSLPKWLEIVRDLHKQGKITDEELEEAHDNAVKSCIKDQELAGVDVITDGELRRETMVYFFTKRIYGFKNDGKMKTNWKS
jgi:5-methyltetrahydropteroyltriglutamate--homocysteine methyltransferase